MHSRSLSAGLKGFNRITWHMRKVAVAGFADTAHCYRRFNSGQQPAADSPWFSPRQLAFQQAQFCFSGQTGQMYQQPQQQYQQQQFGPAQYYSIDVECVATGTDHNSRAVGQIALVDQYEQVILDLLVKPDKPVVSYLTALTGLTAELIDSKGLSLAAAVQQLKTCLPKSAILVGQNILQDVQWLGLREGVDFQSCMDLAGLYRVWNPKYNSWTVFGQDHVATVLLGWDLANMSHNAAFDALKSIKLFNLYQQMQQQQERWQQAQQALLEAKPTLSFAKQNPTYEGVCMGNRRSCTCGAPFFS